MDEAQPIAGFAGLSAGSARLVDETALALGAVCFSTLAPTDVPDLVSCRPISTASGILGICLTSLTMRSKLKRPFSNLNLMPWDLVLASLPQNLPKRKLHLGEIRYQTKNLGLPFGAESAHQLPRQRSVEGLKRLQFHDLKSASEVEIPSLHLPLHIDAFQYINIIPRF